MSLSLRSTRQVPRPPKQLAGKDKDKERSGKTKYDSDMGRGQTSGQRLRERLQWVERRKLSKRKGER